MWVRFSVHFEGGGEQEAWRFYPPDPLNDDPLTKAAADAQDWAAGLAAGRTFKVSCVVESPSAPVRKALIASSQSDLRRATATLEALLALDFKALTWDESQEAEALAQNTVFAAEAMDAVSALAWERVALCYQYIAKISSGLRRQQAKEATVRANAKAKARKEHR